MHCKNLYHILFTALLLGATTLHAFSFHKNLGPPIHVYEFDDEAGLLPLASTSSAADLLQAQARPAATAEVSMSQTTVSLFKPLLERFVLPAMRRSHPLHEVKLDDPLLALKQLQAYVRIPADILAELSTITTLDGAHLDTLTIMPVGFAEVAMHERRYVLRFNGNGSLFEDNLATMARHAGLLQQGIIGFNYRGVGRSCPRPTRSADLVHDGIAEVGALLKAGVPAHHITLHGYSLGGGVATYVAAYFHRQGHHVKLFNDRSFGSLAQVAKGALKLGGSFAARLMVSAGWELNAYAHYQAIPKSAKVAFNTLGDRVVPPAASLSSAAEALGLAGDPTTRFLDGDHDMLLTNITSSSGGPSAEDLLFELARRDVK